jgi:hypothetical protein
MEGEMQRNWAPQHLFARNTDVTLLFDAFLIAAVTTILVNRIILVILDYPQVGGHGLHIAHVLWGGLLLTLSLLGGLLFLGRRRRFPLAVVGGIGFGLFIDELGKFITSDVNYFFRPTPALIYIVFVLLYFAVRALANRGRLSEDEALANVLDALQDGTLGDLDEGEMAQATQLLAGSRESNLVEPLHALMLALRERPRRPPSYISWLAASLRAWYRRVAETRAFQRLTIVAFALHAVYGLVEVGGILLSASGAWRGPHRDAFLEDFALDNTGLAFLAWVAIIASLGASLLMVAGFWRLRRSRLEGYRMFEKSLLLSIFVVQPFTFYEESFVAVVSLGVNLLFLAAVQFVIQQEAAKAGAPRAVGQVREADLLT